MLRLLNGRNTTHIRPGEQDGGADARVRVDGGPRQGKAQYWWPVHWRGTRSRRVTTSPPVAGDGQASAGALGVRSYRPPGTWSATSQCSSAPCTAGTGGPPGTARQRNPAASAGSHCPEPPWPPPGSHRRARPHVPNQPREYRSRAARSAGPQPPARRRHSQPLPHPVQQPGDRRLDHVEHLVEAAPSPTPPPPDEAGVAGVIVGVWHVGLAIDGWVERAQ